jgi:hypothetical protein
MMNNQVCGYIGCHKCQRVDRDASISNMVLITTCVTMPKLPASQMTSNWFRSSRGKGVIGVSSTPGSVIC